MPHVHLLDGKYTSMEIISPISRNEHFHAVEETFTSVDPFGVGHTHTVDTEVTGGLIDIIITRDALERLNNSNEER